MVKVLIVDDQFSVRKALSLRLKVEPDIQVVDEGINAFDGIRLAQEHNPVVIVMDYKMPGMDGIEATGVIKKLCPRSPVIILSFQDSVELAKMARKAGAFTCIGKQEPVETLIDAIRQANLTLQNYN